MHLVLIWLISEPSPLTRNDSWLDSVEGQQTSAQGSFRFKAGCESSAGSFSGRSVGKCFKIK